jgi:hypothetical protein
VWRNDQIPSGFMSWEADLIVTFANTRMSLQRPTPELLNWTRQESSNGGVIDAHCSARRLWISRQRDNVTQFFDEPILQSTPVARNFPARPAPRSPLRKCTDRTGVKAEKANAS